MRAVRGYRRALGLTLWGVVAVFAVAGTAWAQSKTTGALTGKVTDPEGAALPGVRIEISSPALIGGVRVADSDASGSFRFPEITPGSYTLSANLDAFQPVRFEQVEVLLGRTTDLAVKLAMASLEETLVVIGEAAIIDPTSSGTSTNLSNELLQNLPTGRFQPDVLNLAPGINLDSAFGGGSSAANAYQIDGIDTSDPEGGTPWSFVNYNIVEEVELVGLGAPAEYGSFTGVVFNSVTKSGGNDIKGLAEFLFINESMTGDNSDIENINATTERQIDSTVQLGGPLTRDKLWYFLSAQYYKDESTLAGPIRTEESPRAFGKLSWQANQSHNIEGWVEWDRYDIIGRGSDAQTPLEASVTEDAPEYVWNLSWRGVLSPNTIFNVGYGGYDGYYYLDPASGYDVAGRFDYLTQTYNTNSIYYYLADRTRNQLNASISHHASDFIKGDHDFKFGMEIERSTMRSRYGYTTGVWFYDNYYVADDPGTEDYDPVYYSLAYYGNDYDVHAKVERTSLFAQDSWQVTDNFTVNAGLRMELNQGKVTGGTVYENEPIAPRLGFAWDLTRDGKTLLKGHFGRFYEKLVGAQYYWVDPDAFNSGYQNAVFPSGHIEPVGVTAGSRFVIDEDIDHPYLDQAILGIDRDLGELILSGTLIYRENNNLIETVSRDGEFAPITGEVGVTDPVTGERVGTGQIVTLFDYLNPDDDTLIVTNVPELYRRYEAVMITAQRRMRDNWQLMASYVYSKTEGNIDNLIGFNTAYGGNNPGRWLDTPNSLVNADGVVTHDQKHQVKLQGSYVIPALNLTLSGNYTYHSGDTYNSRTTCLLVDDGEGGEGCYSFNQGSVRYFAEPRGSRRLPARNEIDLRAEWYKELGPGQLGLFLDVFNLTNQGRATVVDDRDGSSFDEPLSFSLPRTARIGARFSF